MNLEEVEDIKRIFSDEYTQSVSKMSMSRIGGQVKLVVARLNSATWSPEAAQEEAQQFTNGCLLKSATEYFASLSDESTSKLAKFYGIDVGTLTPYHLVTPIEAAVLEILNQLTGAISFAQYANKKGYEDLILTILSVGRKRLFGQPSYLDKHLTPQINQL